MHLSPVERKHIRWLNMPNVLYKFNLIVNSQFNQLYLSSGQSQIRFLLFPLCNKQEHSSQITRNASLSSLRFVFHIQYYVTTKNMQSEVRTYQLWSHYKSLSNTAYKKNSHYFQGVTFLSISWTKQGVKVSQYWIMFYLIVFNKIYLSQ